MDKLEIIVSVLDEYRYHNGVQSIREDLACLIADLLDYGKDMGLDPEVLISSAKARMK